MLFEIVTVKVGHMEINYGDAHFRRSDNGNALYNPFVGNYIMRTTSAHGHLALTAALVVMLRTSIGAAQTAGPAPVVREERGVYVVTAEFAVAAPDRAGLLRNSLIDELRREAGRGFFRVVRIFHQWVREGRIGAVR
jgi:hypothetical protein